jgi:hypothetical protein
MAWDFSASAAVTEVRIEADTVDENHREPAKSDGIPWSLCHRLSVESTSTPASTRQWMPPSANADHCPAAISALFIFPRLLSWVSE